VVFHIGGNVVFNMSPKQTRIRILLHIPHDEVVDPTGLASDATKTYSHDWAHGICVVDLKTVTQLDDVIALVQQALPLAMSLAEADKASGTEPDEAT
jgi:predicted transport protein